MMSNTCSSLRLLPQLSYLCYEQIACAFGVGVGTDGYGDRTRSSKMYVCVIHMANVACQFSRRFVLLKSKLGTTAIGQYK